MSAKPGGGDGGNRLGAQIAGLEGVVGCLTSTVIAIVVTAVWLWINANLPNLPFGNLLAPASPTVAPPAISQPTVTPLPTIRP